MSVRTSMHYMTHAVGPLPKIGVHPHPNLSVLHLTLGLADQEFALSDTAERLRELFTAILAEPLLAPAPPVLEEKRAAPRPAISMLLAPDIVPPAQETAALKEGGEAERILEEQLCVATARLRELGHAEVVDEDESCCDACDRAIAAERVDHPRAAPKEVDSARRGASSDLPALRTSSVAPAVPTTGQSTSEKPSGRAVPPATGTISVRDPDPSRALSAESAPPALPKEEVAPRGADRVYQLGDMFMLVPDEPAPPVPLPEEQLSKEGVGRKPEIGRCICEHPKTAHTKTDAAMLKHFPDQNWNEGCTICPCFMFRQEDEISIGLSDGSLRVVSGEPAAGPSDLSTSAAAPAPGDAEMEAHRILAALYAPTEHGPAHASEARAIITAELARVRSEAIEACAKIAHGWPGCRPGKPDCAIEIAAALRASDATSAGGGDR